MVAVSISWLPVATVILLMGVGLVGSAIAFRAGRLRSAANWYFNQRLPFYARNFVFAALPSGIGSLALFSVFPLALVDDLWAEFVGLALVGVALLGLLTSIRFMVRPPRMLKPQWIVERESSM